MKKSHYILIYLLAGGNFFISAQDIDCSNYLFDSDSTEPNELICLGYDRYPGPIGGMTSFYKRITEETSKSLVQGKVFVRFLVDTLGHVRCTSVVKSENDSLNYKAVKLIEESEFIPAQQRGKKIVSSMILPIIFGPNPNDKKKKKKRN